MQIVLVDEHVTGILLLVHHLNIMMHYHGMPRTQIGMINHMHLVCDNSVGMVMNDEIVIHEILHHVGYMVHVEWLYEVDDVNDLLQITIAHLELVAHLHQIGLLLQKLQLPNM